MVECPLGVVAIGAKWAYQRVAGVDGGMASAILLADPKDQVAGDCFFGGNFSESPIGGVVLESIAVARATFWIVERGGRVDAGHWFPRTVGVIPTATGIQVDAIAEVVVGGGALKGPSGILPL